MFPVPWQLRVLVHYEKDEILGPLGQLPWTKMSPRQLATALFCNGIKYRVG